MTNEIIGFPLNGKVLNTNMNNYGKTLGVASSSLIALSRDLGLDKLSQNYINNFGEISRNNDTYDVDTSIPTFLPPKPLVNLEEKEGLVNSGELNKTVEPNVAPVMPTVSAQETPTESVAPTIDVNPNLSENISKTEEFTAPVLNPELNYNSETIEQNVAPVVETPQELTSNLVTEPLVEKDDKLYNDFKAKILDVVNKSANILAEGLAEVMWKQMQKDSSVKNIANFNNDLSETIRDANDKINQAIKPMYLANDPVISRGL